MVAEASLKMMVMLGQIVSPHHVVVIGTGFGGLEADHRLDGSRAQAIENPSSAGRSNDAAILQERRASKRECASLTLAAVRATLRFWQPIWLENPAR
jgi:hypothetical protein